jgi:rod shape-determining protein MreD
MPPFGLLILLSWRLLRPEVWRAWIGAPLGLFDDMMSGQPIGSAMFLWTVALIGIDAIEHRLIWRTYKQDWLIATVAIIFCAAGGLFFVAITGGGDVNWMLVAPVTGWSILLFPFIVRQCARIDRWRLMA